MKGLVVILLSFTATLDEIVEFDLKESNFDGAIFCLGCSQWWAIQENASVVLKKQREFQKRAVTEETVRLLQKEALRAEKERRAIWRKTESDAEVFAKLNILLRQNGLNPLKEGIQSNPNFFNNSFLKLAILAQNREDICSIQIIS